MNKPIPYQELKKRYEDLKKKSFTMSCSLKAKTRSELKFRLLAENAPVHLITIDFNGTIIGANKPFNGKNIEALAGSSIFNCIHRASRDTLKKCFKYVRESGKKAKLKTNFISCNSGLQSYEVLISPLSISNIVAGYCMSMTSCHARKYEMESFNPFVDKIWSMAEHMNQGILFQHSDGKFIKANPAALEMIGYKLEQLIGKNITDLAWKIIEAEHAVGYLSQHTFLLSPDSGPSIRKVFVELYNPKQKNQIHLIIHAIPHIDGDNPFCTICILQDITHQKQMQKNYELLTEEYECTLNKLNLISKLKNLCSNCKKIEDEEGTWIQLESFFMKYFNIKFSHGLCQKCTENLYPQFKVYEGKGSKSS